MKKKIGIVYPSYNNYDLLKFEVLKRVNFCDYPVINVDDHSNEKEKIKGKKICEDNNIHFQINKGKGVQLAMDQAINFLSENYDCEWVFCMQQDVFPMEQNFFSEFEKKITSKNLDEIGAMGFNVIGNHKFFYDETLLSRYKNGEKIKGCLGIFTLSDTKQEVRKMPFHIFIRNNIIKLTGIKKLISRMKVSSTKYRVFSPKSFYKFDTTAKKYNGIYACDLPMWVGVAINVKNWKKYIKPSNKFIFHLWFPDVAFQFLYAGKWIANTTDLYLFNDQSSKEKHGFHWSSAHAGRNPNYRYQIEEYGDHLYQWEKKWGFHYEYPVEHDSIIRDKYKGTLIDKLYHHDCRNGPIKTF